MRRTEREVGEYEEFLTENEDFFKRLLSDGIPVDVLTNLFTKYLVCTMTSKQISITQLDYQPITKL